MAAPIQFDKEKVHFNIARLRKAGGNFEVVIDPDKIIDFKEGKVDVKDVLKSEHIYSDAEKGMLASENKIKEVFGTDDVLKVAEVILKQGDIQFTAEYRKMLLDKKRKQIIEIISKNSINPQTKLPHPPARIENAMEEAKVKIDMFKRAEDQVKDIVRKISTIIPIRFENITLNIKLPVQFAAKCYSILKNYGTIKQESWENDGSLNATVEVPGGLKQELIDKINKITHGNNEINIVQ